MEQDTVLRSADVPTYAGVHILGGLLGVLIMLALCIQGSAHLLNPVRVLLYQLVWLVPGLIVTEGARSM